MIKQADINDKRAITGLHYMAGPNLLNFFFDAKNKIEVLSILELYYNTKNNIFSKDNFLKLEENGKLKGAISLYCGKGKKYLELKTLRHIYRIYKHKLYGVYKMVTKIN